MRSQSPKSVLWTCFEASWEQIEPLRAFVASYVRPRLGDGAADDAALAVGELLENAIKYGDLMSEIELDVRFDEYSRSLELRVSNDARQARIRVLRREFDRCQKCDDDPFREAIGRLNKLPAGMTMLGLARVSGVANVALQVNGARVTVVATIGNGSTVSRTGVHSLRSKVFVGGH